MEITYLGHAAFKLRGKQAIIITDPYSSESVGFKFPKIDQADMITVSHEHADHNEISSVGGSPLIISGPGEYEVKGVKITGVSSYHDNTRGSERGYNTIYRLVLDGISIVHLGDLGHKIDEKNLEILDGVDILLIPVGGFYTISSQQAVEVVSQLEPRIVIPMHYNTPKHNQEIFSKLTGYETFLKEMGKEGILPQPKLSVLKDRLPPEMTLVVLE